MVGAVEEALALRAADIRDICRGEVGGKPPVEFDFGNSPFKMSAVDFSGKTVIQRTSAGTQGIVAASRADRLYAASLVTASATARAMLAGSPDQITLVAMGDSGIKRADEDEVCAIHLRNRLQGRSGDRRAVQRLIVAWWRSAAISRSGPASSASRGRGTATISPSGSRSRMAGLSDASRSPRDRGGCHRAGLADR